MPSSLWEPIRVGGLELPNRAVMPAMGTGYSSEEGKPTDQLIVYLQRRAEGGAGLIITEVCAVHPLGKGFPSELGLYGDSFLPGMEILAAEVKASGSAVAAQLHHAGRETFPQFIGEQPVAPSPLASRAMGQRPRALSKKEIAELVDCYAAAAVRAEEAGFDAVEIHGAHGYLVSQFLGLGILSLDYGNCKLIVIHLLKQLLCPCLVALIAGTTPSLPILFVGYHVLNHLARHNIL